MTITDITSLSDAQLAATPAFADMIDDLPTMGMMGVDGFIELFKQLDRPMPKCERLVLDATRRLESPAIAKKFQRYLARR